MTTSVASSRFETYSYTKEQLLLIMDDKNSKNTKKANEAAVRLFEREASSIIAFLRPVNCIVDELPSNICILQSKLQLITKK